MKINNFLIYRKKQIVVSDKLNHVKARHRHYEFPHIEGSDSNSLLKAAKYNGENRNPIQLN